MRLLGSHRDVFVATSRAPFFRPDLDPTPAASCELSRVQHGIAEEAKPRTDIERGVDADNEGARDDGSARRRLPTDDQIAGERMLVPGGH